MKTKPLDNNGKKALYSSLALYGIPSVFCQGAIVHHDDSNSFTVTPDSGEVSWDVDGGNAEDFRFSGYSYVNTFIGTFSTNINLRSSGSGFNGQGFVNQTGDGNYIRNLSTGFSVKNTLAGAYQFNKHNYRILVSSGNAAQITGFDNGVDGYVGFQFDIGENTHNAWAKWTFSDGFTSLTVSEWAYNDVAGDPIRVGAVPEPAETAGALGLLALGAAGVHRWRKQRLSMSHDS